MSAEIIPFPKRRAERKKQAASTAKRKHVSDMQPAKQEAEAYPPGYFVPILNDLARQWAAAGRWSELRDEGVCAILDDARNAGRDWP